MSIQVFRGTMVHSLSLKQLEIVERAAIGVENTGKIAFVSRTEAELAVALKAYHSHSVIDLGSKLITPGFVDTHCHAPQYLFAGLGTSTLLLEWLDKFTFNAETQFKEVEFAKKVYPAVVNQLLRQGTTTVSYFATIHLEATKVLHDICVKAGQRALVGKVCMDRNSPSHYVEASALDSLSTTEQFITYCKEQGSTLVRPTVTPRFAITCTEELLDGLGRLAAKHDCHIQSHLNENINEVAFVEELFPNKSYTQVYMDSGLLTNKTVMAHCIHMKEPEIALMKATGASVSHCPTSNLSMYSGLCQVRRLLESGVQVGLGTDVAGGYSPSILSTMRDAMAVASAIRATAASSSLPDITKSSSDAGLTCQETFFLATLGGAQALSMADSIGNFLPGKDFDALVVNVHSQGSRIDCFGHEAAFQLFEKFIYLGDDRNIEHVFVQGRRVHGHSSSAPVSL